MPIGKFKDFAALKESVEKRHRKPGSKPIGDIDAYTAATADKMEPGWREETSAKAGRTRHMAMLRKAVDRRASFRAKRNARMPMMR